MNQLGTTSKSRLSTCHIDLIKIIEMAIAYSDIDFGVAQGYRSDEEQHRAYLEGKSQIDGITKKGKHNKKPSEAVDIYAYINGLAKWTTADIMYILGVITVCAKLLKERGEITHQIRFGANWDRDGEFITDQNFVDLPHIELIKT